MKLNLLIVFLLGVSVSATGMRGFTPIKGDERRLSPSNSSSKSSSKSSSESSAETTKIVARVIVTDDDEVVRCFGSKCNRFYNKCVVNTNHPNRAFKLLYDHLSSGSKSKSKSSSSDNSRRVRRLKKSSSTSKSKSSDDDDAESDLYVLKLTRSDINEHCQGSLNREALSDSPSESSSSSTSKKSKKG